MCIDQIKASFKTKENVHSPLMVVVDEGRHGADLDGVGVIGWILKQAVVWVKKLPWHQKEKLSGRATVVQSEWEQN